MDEIETLQSNYLIIIKDPFPNKTHAESRERPWNEDNCLIQARESKFCIEVERQYKSDRELEK